MIKILIGFFPWILYFVLVGWLPLTATIAALASACLLGFQDLKKRYFLAWFTFVFFLCLLLLALFFPLSWPLSHPDLIASGALAILAFLSLAIHRPFTLPYGREIFGDEISQSPRFFRINQIVTAFWGVSFILCVALGALQIYGIIGNAVSQIISCILMVLAVWFSLKFPAWYIHRN